MSSLFGRIAVAALALLLLLAPAEARAGGMYWPDIGTVALSRGGAFTARADDPTALIYNPAGAAFLKGTHVALGATLVLQNVSFQRLQYQDPSRPTNQYPSGSGLGSAIMPSIRNSDSPFIGPNLTISTDFGVLHRWNLVVLFGIYGPNAAPNRTYPRRCKPGSNPCEPTDDPNGTPAPQRYDTVRSEALAIYPSVGVAWTPIPQLSFGAVFQIGYARLGYTSVVAGGVGEDPRIDLDAHLEADSSPTPTNIFGVMYRPFPWLHLGVSLRVAFEFKMEGELCTGDRQPDGSCVLPVEEFKKLGLDVDLQPNPAKVSLTIPKHWLLRTGARYIHRDARGRERFDVEFNWVYETTSRVDDINVIPDGSGITATTALGKTKIEKIGLTHAWRNVMSFRLGGSYRIYDLFKDGVIIFRGGLFHETQAITDEWARLDFLPLARYGFAAGIGVRWGRWEFSAAYSGILHRSLDVAPPDGQACAEDPRTESRTSCGSQVRSIVPLARAKDAEDRFGAPVGNGRYQVTTHQVTLGVRVHFGNSSW